MPVQLSRVGSGAGYADGARRLPLEIYCERVQTAFFGVCNVGYNTAGNWSDSARWSCGAVPGAGDSATINGGTVTLDADVTVADRTLTGGTLTGANDLTVTGSLTWSGGYLSGSGATTIGSGATGAFTGAHDHMLLNGRTLDNAGSVTWTGARNLYIYTGGALNNSGTCETHPFGDTRVYLPVILRSTH